MAKTMIVLMNHKLTAEQQDDARETLGVTDFLYPPKEFLDIWANIPADANMWNIQAHLVPVYEWIESVIQPHSVILVQGEMVATYQFVNNIRRTFAMQDVRCVAATSCRASVEEELPDGTIQKKSVFRHVRFRAYY
jgi:hypothetical protein